MHRPGPLVRLLAPAAGLVCGLASPDLAQPFTPEFDTYFGFDTGFYPDAQFPYHARIADLDGDGQPDAVTALWWWPTRVSVLLGLGDGEMAAPVYYETTGSSSAVEVGDIDDDGDLDVFVAITGANWNGTTVDLLRNRGDGTFDPAESFPVGDDGPVGMAVADFDDDGRLDLVVANPGRIGLGNTFSLLLGDGVGLGAPTLFATPPGPQRLAAGDLDADGLPDVAVACENRKLAIYRNTGTGFAPPIVHVTDPTPWAGDYYQNVVVADADNDQDLDVFYSSSRTQLSSDVGAVALFRNQGNGTLLGPERIALPPYLGGSFSTAVRDVTMDGWPDLLTVHLDAGGWALVPGDGAGGFLPGAEHPGGEDCAAIDAIDTTGDSGPEIWVLSRNSLELSIYPTANGEVILPPSYPLGSFDHWMDAGDLDDDGDLDLATAYGYAGSGGVRVLRNRGDGTFLPPTTYSFVDACMAVKLRDLDGDGSLDLLWADHPTSPDYDFVVRLNQGNGTFGPATVWTVGTCGNGDVEAFDMDHDGDLDVFLTDYLGCSGGGPSNFIWIRRNNGDATFQAPYVYETYTSSPEIVRGADVNEDGHPDLLWTEANWIGVALGDGAGAFGPFSLFEVDWGPKHFSIDDLDGDGHLDVATANMNTDQQSMCVLFGRGDGTFDPRRSFPAAYSPDLQGVHAVRTGDVDGDGNKDVLVLNGPSGDVGYYRSLGDRSFDRHVRYGVGPVSTDFAYADFTGDGEADLAAIVGLPPSNLPRDVAIVTGLATDPASSPGPDPTRPSSSLELAAPQPSPFTSRTEVRFHLAQAGPVRLSVHDASGRRVASLVRGPRSAGEQVVVWDGRDDLGRPVPTGAYWVRLSAGGESATHRVLRLR